MKLLGCEANNFVVIGLVVALVGLAALLLGIG